MLRAMIGFKERTWRITLYKRELQPDGRVADVEMETFDQARAKGTSGDIREETACVSDGERKRSSNRWGRLCCSGIVNSETEGRAQSRVVSVSERWTLHASTWGLELNIFV